jgi:putative membrane protein
MKDIKFIRKTFLQVSIAVVIIAGISSCSQNQQPINAMVGSEKSDSTSKVKDSTFLANAAQVNLLEIQLGKLAEENSTMADVKQMGKMMEDDHNKCMDGLISLANKESITLPTGLTRNAAIVLEKVSAKSGPAFDKEYCNAMVDGHKDAIKMFEKEVAETNDIDIKEWANATLVNLHKHLDHATDCKNECDKM